jgi:hypothetical protein
VDINKVSVEGRKYIMLKNVAVAALAAIFFGSLTACGDDTDDDTATEDTAVEETGQESE